MTASAPSIKILVVDDDDVDREKTIRLLYKVPLSIDVFEACSAIEAAQRLQVEIFDCVIVDYRLNDADGTSLIKPIQTHRIEPVPIIMVSGLGDERVAADAIRDGVFEYLPKRTLHCDQLHATIEAALEWARSEHELTEARARFFELSNGLPQLIWTCTPDGECDYLNQRWIEFTGIPAEQQYGYRWMEQVHPDDKPTISAAWKRAINDGAPLSVRYRLRRYDGLYRLFESHAEIHKDSLGNVKRWMGSSTDITDAENARLAQSHLAAIVETSSDAIISKDLKGYITSWNRSAELLFGYSADEALGKKLVDLIVPDDKAAEENDLVQRLKLGQRIKAFETVRRSKDGRRLPVSLTFSAVMSTEGKLIGFAQIARNISDKLAAESALLRSEERFRAMFNSAPVGMALVSLDGMFVEANRALQELLECEFNQLRKLTQAEITNAEDQVVETAALKKITIAYYNVNNF